MKKTILVIACVICLSSCNKVLYNYYNYNELAYTYSKGGWEDKEMKKMVKQYKKIVEIPKGKTVVPPPGCCVDYACMLIQQGDTTKAKVFFDKEILLYPESKMYVDNLKKEIGL
ncbi:MAG: DUF4810 domain-containing protein [Bacteroidales bacterium]|jgi:hypothetical protein|nr:DUF4810 domain-containing protein [Bacteroidales bacterium]